MPGRSSLRRSASRSGPWRGGTAGIRPNGLTGSISGTVTGRAGARPGPDDEHRLEWEPKPRVEPAGEPVDIDAGDGDVHVGREHADQEHRPRRGRRRAHERLAATRAHPRTISAMPDTTMIVVAAGTQAGRCCSNGVVLTRWLTPATTKAIPSPHCAA